MSDFLLISVFAFPFVQAWGTALVAMFWVAGRLFSQRVRPILFILAGLAGGGLLFWGWHSLPADTKTFLDLAYSTLLFLVSVGLLLTILPRFIAVRRERGQVVAGATRPEVWTGIIALAGFLYFMSGAVLLDYVLTTVAAGGRPDSWYATLTTFELLLQANLIYLLSLIFMRQVSRRGVLVRLTFFPWKTLQSFQIEGRTIWVAAPPRNRVLSKNPVSTPRSIHLHILPEKCDQVQALIRERIQPATPPPVPQHPN